MRKIAAILLAIISFSACAFAEETAVYQGAEFKSEYEILNGQYTLDGSNIYKTISVPEDADIIYVTLAEANEILKSGTGIIYFGFPECPWCRTLVPVLFEAVTELTYDGPIYYCNCLSDRDSKYLDDGGNLVVESEGTPEYEETLSILGDLLDVYKGLNDPAIKRLYLPTTVFVYSGQIADAHLVTVDSQESGYDELTDTQHAELLSSLKESIAAIMK